MDWAKAMSVHTEQSSYREKLLEHLFVGDVLRELWSWGVTDAEFLRPEVDCGGYDRDTSLKEWPQSSSWFSNCSATSGSWKKR